MKTQDDSPLAMIKARKREYIANIKAQLKQSQAHYVKFPTSYNKELINNLQWLINREQTQLAK